MIHVGKNPIFIYVDVDDTFVRSIGNKRIPIPAVIKQIRRLFEQNAVLYCWSSGGSEYAKQSAEEFGIADCFKDFLPKPNILIDDQPINEWRYLNHIYPAESENIILDKENQEILLSMGESAALSARFCFVPRVTDVSRLATFWLRLWRGNA